MKARKKRYHDEDLDLICHLYHSDFDKEQMLVQLQLLGASFDVVQADGATSIFHVKEYFMSLSQGLRSLMWQVVELLQFIIVNPATNATSERSSRALRHLRSYLSTTMLQESMNYLMLRYVHEESTDDLDRKAVLTEFIGEYCWRCWWQFDSSYVGLLAI